jgi:RNA-directed DNA polymerase
VRVPPRRYTRYADDLAFSFDELPSADRFLTLASTVALEEGFAVNFRKTRRLRGGARQRLAGVVVNAHPNVPREEFDWLKAVLHNCRRWGPSTQHRDGVPNLRAQLTGHVAWVTMVNPQRGARLRAMLGEIDWLS